MILTAYIVEELESDIEEGDMVEYGDGKIGVVTEKNTENFEFPGGTDPNSDPVEIDATKENPVYIVAREDGGSKPMLGSEITPVDRDKVLDDEAPDPKEDVEKVGGEMSATLDEYEACSDPHTLAGVGELLEYDPTDMEAEELVSADSVPGVSRTDTGRAPWPESWRESDTPARIIALDAWSSWGASHTGCTREMKGRIRQPNAFCAAFKDAILGYKTWRK